MGFPVKMIPGFDWYHHEARGHQFLCLRNRCAKTARPLNWPLNVKSSKAQPVKNTAILSACRKYRFALWRTWDDAKPYVLFVGLNPSTADETTDDPTLTRCINYAKLWGFGGVCMANLFAFRATEPNDMKAATDPIGSENNAWLKKLAADAGLVVAAWGNEGSFLGRSEQVKEFLPNVHCLKLNKSGEPAHPLYQKADIQPVHFYSHRAEGGSGVARKDSGGYTLRYLT